MSALIKNNLMHLYNEKYTFIYDARNITDKYSYNESINTLHLIDNCIIEVHSWNNKIYIMIILLFIIKKFIFCNKFNL